MSDATDDRELAPADALLVRSSRGVDRPRAAGSPDRLAIAVSVVGLIFLAYLIGLISAAMDVRPYRWARDAVTAVRSLVAQGRSIQDPWPRFLWNPAPPGACVPRFAGDGSDDLLLISTAGSSATLLIDRSGQEVYRWDIPFHSAFPKAGLRKRIVANEHVLIRDAQALPNGDLVALYECPLSTPNGFGLARFAAGGEVAWGLDEDCHHDFDIDESGEICVLTQRVRRSPDPRVLLGDAVNLEDFLAIVDAQGRVLKQFSLLTALVESPHYRPDVLLREQHGDLLHANSVHWVSASFAAYYPEVHAGDVMVCFRNLNLVAIIHPASGRLVWATSGPWHFPHDPDPLDSGNLLIFDNCHSAGTRAGSRVLEFDPRSGSIVWQYAGDAARPLRSDIRAHQQRLKNGHTVICESSGGRVLEVAADGELMWEYIVPARGGQQRELIPVIGVARCYGREELPFLQGGQGERPIRPGPRASRELTGTAPLATGDARSISPTE